MDFYFTDRKFNLLGIASTSGGNPLIFNDVEDELSIDAAVRTLRGMLLFDSIQSEQVANMGNYGNYILYKDKLGKSIFMTIMENEHDPLDGTHVIVAEDAGIDLINELVGSYKADKAYNIDHYINRFTYDSGFEIGINEIPEIQRKLEWEGEEVTALARLLSVATQFGNAEIDFSFSIEGTQVVKRYINIYKKRGSDKRVTLYVNKDINKIVTKGNIYDLGTAIYATGGTPEGKNEPINLKGYNYKDPNGRFVLTAAGNLLDTESVRLWSRLLSNENPNPQKAHILRRKSYETTSKKTLCDNAVRELEKISQPALNFEVDIAVLPKDVQIGDTIYLVDEFEKVYLSARILNLKQNYATDNNVATLGDYLIQDDGVSLQLKELADKIKNIPKGDTPYPWVRYADDENGKGISAMPLNKKYMAIKFAINDPVPSDDPLDYQGLWTKIAGPQGENGVEGPPGADGKPTFMWVMYADTHNGFGISNDPAGKQYLGVAYNKTESEPSTNPSDYTWSAMYDEKRLDDMQDKIDGIVYSITSITAPQNPKVGQQWWQQDKNNPEEIIGYFVWDGSKWQAQTIQQSILNVVKLNAVEIIGSKVTGTVINGSSVNNTFTVKNQNYTLVGTTTLKDSEVIIDYVVKETSQYGYTKIYPQGLQSATFAQDGTVQSSLDLTSSSLSMLDSSGNNGILTAQNLTKSVWKTLPLASGITVAEGNKPMYRIIKNLDGSWQVQFKGQCAGKFSGDTLLATVPAEARPAQTEFAYGASSTGNGGRLAVTTAGRLRFMVASGTTPSYCALSALTYSF